LVINKTPVSVDLTQYEYPKLEAIQKAADFDNPLKRTNWWNALEKQWQKAFNQVVLKKSDDYEPTDEEKKYILETPILRLEGPNGMHPSIDFMLTNLSGVIHLSELTHLIASHLSLSELKGTEHLKRLTHLFVNDNKLTNLKEIHYLPQLKQLYCNSNQITDLLPLSNLCRLEVLNCQYNNLISLEGITTKHSVLKDFVVLPNDNIMEKELAKIEGMGIKCRKG